MNIFKKCIEWLKISERWKHVLYGILIGIGANSVYCAAYAGIGIASALEFKDKVYNYTNDPALGWNWIDWILTIIAVAIGYLMRIVILSFLINTFNI